MLDLDYGKGISEVKYSACFRLHVLKTYSEEKLQPVLYEWKHEFCSISVILESLCIFGSIWDSIAFKYSIQYTKAQEKNKKLEFDKNAGHKTSLYHNESLLLFCYHFRVIVISDFTVFVQWQQNCSQIFKCLLIQLTP